MQYLRPDVCLCGGITGAKKIAALAEALDAWVVPHNPLSPVSTAACLQIAACIPNFAIQEYPSRTPDLDGGKELLGNDLATGLSEQVGGFIAIPTRRHRRRTRAGCGKEISVPAAPDRDATACGWVDGGSVDPAYAATATDRRVETGDDGLGVDAFRSFDWDRWLYSTPHWSVQAFALAFSGQAPE